MSLELAKKSLKKIYNVGGISSDVYDQTLSNIECIDIEGLTNKKEIMSAVLEHLNDVGGVSTDVYYTICEEEGLKNKYEK